MKNLLLSAGLLLAVCGAASAQSPKDGTRYYENGVTYESYIDHEYTLSDPLNAATACGADQIAREDTHRKFVPYAKIKDIPLPTKRAYHRKDKHS